MKVIDALLLAVTVVAVILVGDRIASPDDKVRGGGPEPVRWEYIVLHHTADTGGSHSSPVHRSYGRGAETFHFLVTPGAGGEVDLTARWLVREPLRHTAQPALDAKAVSVAVAGDFDRTPADPANLTALVRLLRALQKEFNIPTDRIVAHRQAEPFDSHSLTQGKGGRTTCPGRYFDAAKVRRMVDGIE